MAGIAGHLYSMPGMGGKIASQQGDPAMYELAGVKVQGLLGGGPWVVARPLFTKAVFQYIDCQQKPQFDSSQLFVIVNFIEVKGKEGVQIFTGDLLPRFQKRGRRWQFIYIDPRYLARRALQPLRNQYSVLPCDSSRAPRTHRLQRFSEFSGDFCGPNTARIT